MQAAADRLDAGPMWRLAHERYCELVRNVPGFQGILIHAGNDPPTGGHLGLERLVLELDAEVQRLRATLPQP
jgi:hypothetical protein